MQQKQGGCRKALVPVSGSYRMSPRASEPLELSQTSAGLEAKKERLAQLIIDTKAAVQTLAQASRDRLDKTKTNNPQRSKLRAICNGYDLLLELLEMQHITDYCQRKDIVKSDGAETFLKTKVNNSILCFSRGNFSKIKAVSKFKTELCAAISSSKSRINGGVIIKNVGEEQFENFVTAFTLLHKNFVDPACGS